MKNPIFFRLLIVCLLVSTAIWGQTPPLFPFPAIGAQVFIEPGQKREEIAHWFELLKAHHMPVCRIRMHQVHLQKPDGSYDFSLYDAAFDEAQRNGVKIYATVFPAGVAADVGGFKFPETDAHWKAVGKFIQQLVTHYKDHPALAAWVLLNEPGVGGIVPNTPFSQQKLKEWQAKQPAPVAYNGYARHSFDQDRFLREYTTWYLGWIAAEIRKYDTKSQLHVNNHMLFNHLPEYDFAAWRGFLSTLGASMHPSWHFGYFHRNQYPMAMAANCDLIRSGAGPLPFWVTELQGGNNTYSSFYPITPSAAEIAQWLWHCVGSGARGVIFWSLNPRATADEAGEWAMIDFLGQPTDRLTTAAQIAQILQKEPFFQQAAPVEAPITLLYSWEAMLVQKRREIRSTFIEQYHAGRLAGAPIQSALAVYEALLEQGMNPAFTNLEGFDWARAAREGQTVILANQVALHRKHAAPMTEFVQAGGRLIVLGLSGHFDEYDHNVLQTDFPLQTLLGAKVKEFRVVGDSYTLPIATEAGPLPAHLWRGTLAPTTAQPIATDPETGEVLAVRHQVGKGEVLWLPSLVELGAWRRDNRPLAAWLRQQGGEAFARTPFAHAHQPLVLTKTLRAGNAYATITTNKQPTPRTIRLQVPEGLRPRVLFGPAQPHAAQGILEIPADACAVVLWE